MILTSQLGFWITVGIISATLLVIGACEIYILVRQSKDPTYSAFSSQYEEAEEILDIEIGKTTLREARDQLSTYKEHKSPDRPDEIALISKDYILYFKGDVLIDIYEK